MIMEIIIDVVNGCGEKAHVTRSHEHHYRAFEDGPSINRRPE